MDLISSEKFSIIYHGTSLDEGQIEVKELAPSLLALDDLIERANRQLNGSQTKTSLKISANLQTSSVEIALEVYQWATGIAQEAIEDFKSLNMRDVLEILGCAWGAYKGGLSLIGLLKRLKGKEVIEAKKDKENHYLLVAIDSNGEKTEVRVPLEVYLLFSNHLIRVAINKVLAPLKKEGMEKVEWKYKNKIVEQITKAELSAFEPPEADPETSPDDVVVGRFTIRSISFDKSMKWRLVHAQTARKFSVTISDDSFWQGIEEKKESFHKGDVLEARVEAVTSETKTGPRTEWYATNIIKHYISRGQNNLNLGEPR